MNNLQAYLQSRFQEYYKVKPGFGITMDPEKRQIRMEMQNMTRKQIRTNVLLDRRNINAMETTTPEAKKTSSNNSGKVDRMALLKRWKAEKENKLKNEKAKKKPIFKTGGPANVGFPELKDSTKTANVMDKVTKATGGPSTSKIKNLKKSFAPKDHKFVAPKNLKSINMTAAKYANQQKSKELNFNLKLNEVKNKFNRVTRSQKPVASPPLPLPTRRKRNEILVNKNNVIKPTLAKQTNKNEKEKFLSKQEDVRTMLKPKGRLVRQNAISVQTEEMVSCDENDVLTEEIQKDNNKTSKRQSWRKSVRKSTTIQEQFQVDEVKNGDEQLKVSRCSSSDMSPEYSILNSSIHNETLEDNVFVSDCENVKTPDNNKRTSVYVSPFVTTSRGKGSVKKENLERSVRGLPSFTKHNTPDIIINSAVQATGAAYFHTVLTNEITRLLSICDTWNQYKEADNMSEDATDMIDVAVGQATLLINKKFQQFRGLIHSCENGGGEGHVTCEDLQGFWDMVYMQVENLNVRFNRLTEMRNNNWEEIKVEVKPKVVKKRAPPKKSKSVPSANLRATIRAARMKSQLSSTESIETDEPNKEYVFNGGFFVVRSPHKKTPTRTPNKTSINKRRSLLVSVLSAEVCKKQSSLDNSPGVTMMKASQTAKSIENIAADSVKDFALSTPGRGILKNAQNRKSYFNTSKAVLFKDESNDDNETEYQDQNKSTSNFIVEDTTEKTPKKKSRRSSLKK